MSCIVEFTVDSRSHVVLILGSGLVGSAISRELSSRYQSAVYLLIVEWDQVTSNVLDDAFQKFLAVLSKRRADCSATPRAAHVIWAAGRSSFASNKTQSEIELGIFSNCLELTSNLGVNELGYQLNFHLVSSIGGLFEGQYLVSENSVPNPIRPYGHLKLSQENILSDFGKTIVGHVYRLSSVYGFIRPMQRRGLISTLIENSVKSQVTLISGSMHTLRDFVWAPDVARFIGKSIINGEPSKNPIFLASGKSETVENIKRLIELSLRRKLYSKYLYMPTNDASICVSQAILPCEWRPSYCTSNIQQVITNYRLSKSTESMESIKSVVKARR